MINTFQKWETTIESVSYVTKKTIAISDYASDASDRPRSASISAASQSRSPSTARSRSATPGLVSTTTTTTTTSATTTNYTDAKIPNGNVVASGLPVKQTAI